MPISISLSRYGYRGWLWTEYDTETDEMFEYRTDERGDGLWKYVPTGASWYGYDPLALPVMEWKQQVGTCQYHLPYKRNSAWVKIRRRLGKEY